MVAPHHTPDIAPHDLVDMLSGIAGTYAGDLEMPPALAAKVAAERRQRNEERREYEAQQQWVVVVLQGSKQKLVPLFRG